MALYEFAVYNAEVRKMVEEGKQHHRLTPDWADMQYIEINAPNEQHARGKFEEMHPSSEGFVIGDVMETG
jgi:hypothetical protein